VNLDEFGIPFATGVTPSFSVYRFQLRASQTLFDAAAFSRLSAERNAAIASGQDDSAVAAELLDQSRKLVDAGVSPAIDATRSQVSYGSVQTQLEVARNSRDRA